MNTIDTCGMSCPQPVLLVKNAIQSYPKSLSILADNTTAENNIKRFLINSGYSVSSSTANDTITLLATKNE